MEKLFYPDSVMVFGVSSAPTNLGRFIVDNLDRFGFKGSVYLIGRDGGMVNGRKIWKRVDDVQGCPDLAVVLLPAHAVPDALELSGRKGVRYAAILSGGFSEFGEDRKDIEERILEIARKWDVHFVGPNCLGIVNMENGLAVPFVPMETQLIKKGPLSMMAQSGGVMMETIKLLSQEQIGVSKLVSMGNKLDLDENDYLEFMISDPETKIIALYLENIAGGRRLMNLAGRSEKPMILLKANRNSSSHEIAHFHTSALAGDDIVADAALRQAGIHRVETMQEMIDCIKIFSLPLIRGKKLAVLGRSGGLAVLLADAVHHYGFKLAELSDDFFDLVKREVKAGVIRMTNPLDMGDIFNINIYVQLMEKALQERDVDGLVISHSYVINVEIEPSKIIIQEAKRLCEKYEKPVVFCLIADRENVLQINPTEDFPVFADVDHAVKALSMSYEHYRKQQLKADGKGFGGLRPMRIRKKLKVQNAVDIYNLLERHRLPVVPCAMAANEKEALVAAKKMSYPVALKTASLAIVHKTEAGGVKLDIKGPAELRRAFRAMVKTLQKVHDGDSLLVQKMSSRGQEVFIGGRQDPEFGPVVLFGLGGIFVEVLKDVVMRVAPIDERTAREMLWEIQGAALLKGFRGRPPCDVTALARCLVRVSRLLAEHPEIGNLDINPLVVFEKGRGCVIVDVKMEIN